MIKNLRFQIYRGKLEFYGHHEDRVEALGVGGVEKSTRQEVEVVVLGWPSNHYILTEPSLHLQEEESFNRRRVLVTSTLQEESDAEMAPEHDPLKPAQLRTVTLKAGCDCADVVLGTESTAFMKMLRILMS